MISSLFKKQHRFSLSRALGVTIALAGLTTQGCIGDDEGGGGGEPTVGDFEDQEGYSFKAYFRGANETDFRLLETAPMEAFAAELSLAASRKAQAVDQPFRDLGMGTGQKEQAAFTYRDNESNELVGTPWSPAYFAAAACATEHGTWASPVEFPNFGPGSLFIWAGSSAGSPGGAPDYPYTCDGHLLTQQNMLCTAAKLAEIAEAVEPITLKFSMGIWGNEDPRHTVVIPPQSTQDRFIIRDQALVILDLLSKLAVSVPVKKVPSTNEVSAQMNLRCTQAFVNAYNDPTVNNPIPVFAQVPWVDLKLGTLPATPSPEQKQAFVRPRAELQAHVIRAATRLTRELVEKSLTADLGGAEKARARATAEAWAMDPKKNLQGYNSYRHAVRVLLGSWEPFAEPLNGGNGWSDSAYLGPMVDPKCSGYANIRTDVGDEDLVDLIPGLELEVSLTAPSTSGQSLAWRMFRASGLVIPDPKAKPVADVRNALRQLLLAQAAVKADVETSAQYSAFVRGPIAVSTIERVKGLKDADLLYGADRALTIYSLLTNQETPAIAAVPALPAGPTSVPWGGNGLATTLAAVSGFAIAGGLPEHELNRSTFTKFAAAARDCSSGVRKIAERLQRPLDDLSLIEPTERLVNEAISEVRSLTATSKPALFRSLVGVDVVQGQATWRADMYPTAAGLEKLQAVWDDLILVQGGPMEAECAAGLRTICSGSATLPVLQKTPPTVALPFGSIHVGRLADNAKPIWAILEPRGHEPGQILGMKRLVNASTVDNLQPVDLSDWELELLARVQSGRTIASPDCTAVYDAANTSHCIPDVARDAFVPVANALTGEGQDVDESWRHYLDLAKVASAEADELGRQIIEVGTTKDLRRENAQLALGQMCGGFPEEADLLPQDGEANACLDEDDVDVVYFGEEGDAVVDLGKTLCSATGTGLETDLCKKAAGDPELEPLSVEALGFTTADGDAAQPTDSWKSGYCDLIYQDLGQEIGVPGADIIPGYGGFINGGDITQGRALQAVNRLRLSENDLVGQDWVVTRGESPMLAWVSWPEDSNGAFINDTTVAGQPAPGVFGEFPGCFVYSRDDDLHCSDGWDGCCSLQAKKIMKLMGIVQGTTPNVEASYWRQAVESALWRLGHASNAIPAGLFTVPVPLRNWPVWQGIGPSDGEFPVYFGLPQGGVPRDITLLNGTVLTLPTVSSDGGDLWAPAPPQTASAKSGQFWERDAGQFALVASAPEDQVWMTIASNAATAFRAIGGGEQLSNSEFGDRLFNHAPAPMCYRSGYSLIPKGGKLIQIKVDSCTSPDVLESIDWPTLAELMPNSDIVADPHNYRVKPYYDMCDDGDNCFQQTTPYEALPEDCEGEMAAICDACEVTVRAVRAKVLDTECPAGDRVFATLSSSTPDRVAMPLAAALMCLANESRTIEVATPPVVRSATDVDVLRTWLEGQANNIADIQRTLFAINIPRAAVEYHQEGLVPFGAVGSGERGEQILRIASALEEVDSGFRAVRGGVEHLAAALGGAESQFEAVELAGDKELLGIALQKVDASRQIAQGVITISRGQAATANFFAGAMTGGSSISNGVHDTAAGIVDTVTGMEKLGLMDEMAAVAALQEINSTAQVIADLNAALLAGIQEIETGVSQIGQAQLAVLGALNDIRNRESAAGVQKAIMEGEDFADLNGDGEPDVALPVNTVYRRQYDVLRARYDAALASAKRYAYYARLAMEQRLGVRLSNLREPLGPVPAPSSWVDDVCQMTGIDYDALRTSCAKEEEGCIDGGTELDEGELIAEFASQYIGDYVNQLEEFLENYNIKYPFQDSQDLAVISVRDHVVTPQVCDALPTNLLAASGDLTRTPAQGAPGWTHSSCSGDSCLEVKAAVDMAAAGTGLALSAPLDPPVPGGASQVRVYPRPVDLPASTEPAFPTSVYQKVELKKGATYEFSWWDSGATPGQNQLPDGGHLYYALVFDANDDAFVFDLHESHQRTEDDTWSARRQVQFTVPNNGTYFVGFQFLADGTTAIANVQLTDMADTVTGDAPYVHTDQFGKNSCVGATAESFAEHFDHKCDDRGCYYELSRDFLLKDKDILDAAFAEAGIPAGNYNYRHLGVAANAVGTGLVDCDGQNTSCFANSFLEYDLEHAAFASHVTNYGGDQQCFSFGRGAIRHGKMLAAERVLGIPMSSTDEDLLADEDFMKPILKGRPIDGQYHLRIYDREGFNIEQLEDVQIVLKHVYWSRVERSAD